ncbi:hypothetical protein N7474_000704 [Penicillium riverlandense]|uniref:uncharacterized protein n=1 Tax=Penicillium riverlandense TaxID=1903569 RepID=UPI002548C12D|nr:uncharacterized protein N7474_000704 [Penicillium riverlandense]KAJ5832393.1 hypothetical protein N7474_000704 [Penicillium riverlandense]
MATAAPTSAPLADLPLEQLTLYHAVDSCLSSVLIFHGPVATANATVSSSRIQAHVLSPAGFHSYPRMTVSPAAPLYAAVNHLPREKQGDEVCRGLAVSMLKYFTELSDPVKHRLMDSARRPGGKIPRVFDEMHAADLANRMVKVENQSEITRDIRSAFGERKVPWVDVDVFLPAGTIQKARRGSAEADIEEHQDLDYGPYTPLIETLGEPMFLPTSRLKRAPSQPTNASKSRIFSRSQKEALRLTMCELVDTEERYVAKLYTLVHEVADEFRQKAREREPSSSSPDETALQSLFPPCLNEILEVNHGFLNVIRQVLDETEKDAMSDISQDTELPSSGSHRNVSRDGQDAIGAVAFAKALLEWLPRFSQPYADYMRVNTGFTSTLSSFTKDKNSSFSEKVYETGEQRLRSLLMEPVQRLPRYSLLIDTMTGNLPLVHPAVRPLLRARDIIKDICALDNPSPSSHAQSLQRLRELVDGWPAKIFPEGRLITAVDFHEVAPPYRLDAQVPGPSAGLMLLYKNCLVMLVKPAESRTTARGLLADIDNAVSTTNDVPGSLPSSELKVAQVMELHTVRCMQSACGRILFIVPASAKHKTSQRSGDLLALELTATYEGKATRLIEEIAKAKIEGRFSEQEREEGKWTLRSPAGSVGNVGILACVFEEGPSTNHQIQPSPIRVVFNTSKAICEQMLSNTNLEAIVSISRNGDLYRVDVDSVIGSVSTDMVLVDSFIATLSKRLQNLISPLHGPPNPVLTAPLVNSNFEIIRYLTSNLLTHVKSSRGFRPPSPTKLLSNLLGGNQSRDNVPTIKAPSSATLTGEFPKIPPPRGNLSRSNTLPSTFPAKDKEKEEGSNRISVVGPPAAKGPDGQSGSLEQTLAAYVLSLQSRSGNILGRMLRAREHVDRAPVNELYNILLEDPSKIQAAAEVPVDTLFVAFETFMANAWRSHMGPVLDASSLKLLQTQFDSMFPRDFDENFRRFLADISPQNRRALAAIIRLLAELLDASGNDGDRGALTVAFAEVLTEEGDPVQHVSLLDRLVEDFDSLFEEFVPGGASVEGTLTCDQTKPSHNTGSVGSNASSFRKRFGFSLHHDKPKNEGESKVASILRTLSKKQSPAGSEPGTPKGSLIRSKSTDVDVRLGLLRPSSRDHPYGFASEEQISRPGTGFEQPPSLSSIQGISHDGVVKIRRKRRSSLSDFRPPTAGSDASNISPIHPLRPVTPSNRPQIEPTTPKTQSRPQSSYLRASPARSSSPMKSSSPARFGSPIRRMSPPPRPSTPSRKENIDPKTPLTERIAKANPDAQDSPLQESKRRSRATSIPQRTPGLRERPSTNGSDTKRPQSSSSSPQKSQKLRMQSPQKLRDRVQNEKKAQATSQLSLRDELTALNDELRTLKLTPTKQSGLMQSVHAPSSDNTSLESRMRNLEARFDMMSGEYNGRTAAIEKDLESSLLVSEKRVKKLDELYREASAENEALYDRFNSELSKIARDVRSGNAEDALRAQLTTALDEIGRLKKENFRLKREIGGLRAQQAAVSLLRASEQ